MTLVTPLASALLFCSLPSICQVTANFNQAPDLGSKAAQAAEPWRIFKRDATPHDPLAQILGGSNAYPVKGDQSFNLHFNPAPETDKIAIWPDVQYGSDSVCFTIRSYVVTRDDNNSDSVHPVSYSTCQPATRYRLKEAVIQRSASDE